MSAKVYGLQGDQGAVGSREGAIPTPFSAVAGCAGYSGEDKGGEWVEKTLGWSVEIVRRAQTCSRGSIDGVGLKQWAKEGVRVDWQELLCHREDFRSCQGALGCRENVLAWISHNRRMSLEIRRG
jgi:hypothetical protein